VIFSFIDARSDIVFQKKLLLFFVAAHSVIARTNK